VSWLVYQTHKRPRAHKPAAAGDLGHGPRVIRRIKLGRSWSRFPAVCSYWRNTFLATPSIWTKLNGRGIEKTRAGVRRSKGLPIQLEADTRERATKSFNLPATLDALEQPVALPPSLLAKERETREHDTPSSIERYFEVIEDLASQNTHTLKEVTPQALYAEHGKVSHMTHRRLEFSTRKR